ncbi:MAG: spore maturation protein [Brevinema sp.]
MFVKVMHNISLYAVPLILLLIPLYAFVVKKVKVYEVFVEGAKEGFETAVRILPFLLGMLVSIGILRESGVIDFFVNSTRPFLDKLGFPSQLIPILAFNPISGGAAKGALLDIFNIYGPDSFLGRAGSAMFGSTETTLYVLAVYFGSVGITKSRHAVATGFMADFFGMVSAVIITSLIFGRA